MKYTGRGEDISPDLRLSAISEKAKSIAVILDDLDKLLDLSSNSGKKELLKAMEGHILQHGSITGIFQ